MLLGYIHHYFSTLNHSRYHDMHPDAHLHVLILLLPFHFPSPQIFKISRSCSILPFTAILIHAPVFQLP